MDEGSEVRLGHSHKAGTDSGAGSSYNEPRAQRSGFKALLFNLVGSLGQFAGWALLLWSSNRVFAFLYGVPQY